MFDIYNRRYTGSKAKLMEWIRNLILENCQGESFFDIFAGTGVVTYYMLNDFNEFYINDFLYSNEVIYKAFFENASFDINKLNVLKQEYNDINILEENYVSVNFGNKYFSINDSKKIGYIRENIDSLMKHNIINDKEYHILIASLLYSMDRISNTVGHYDAYIKKEKVQDQFIFDLIKPIVNDKDIYIFRDDSNTLAKKIHADIVFFDPPYNSRQYSRFYHVLENITTWHKPELYGVAMKPKEENMSDYCRNAAPIVFKDLVDNLTCRYIVVTYNNTYTSKSSSSKNKMTLEQIQDILSSKGKTKVFKKNHNAFNSGKTDLKDHKEYVFITEVQNG
ncbi:MAG: DNA adenine methylase [Erysipelotrichaceae bacterium]|nr:DNA adenine methylase [Erysipelotrichaceae bacterium]